MYAISINYKIISLNEKALLGFDDFYMKNTQRKYTIIADAVLDVFYITY